MIKSITHTIACAVLVVVAWNAEARDIVVDGTLASANDSNPGTDASPLKTLTAGVAIAMPGDTVIVKPGRYTDPNATWYSAFTPARSGTSAAPITIKSVPRHGAVLVPRNFSSTAVNTYPALSIYSKKYIVVDGFKAEGMLKIHEDAGLDQFVTIQNCIVLYGSQQGDDPSLNWGIAVHTSNRNIVRNNRVSSMRSSGNNSQNTAAIMVFASNNNLIENNDADGGNGVVGSAYGQKAGQIHHNIWRRNIARNAPIGFLGKGSTAGDQFSDYETFYQNIIIDCVIAFNLNHNSRYWAVYNNTAYNVQHFMMQWQLSSVGNQYWNNLVVASVSMYQIEDLSSASFAAFITYSNYNLISSTSGPFARWQYGSGAMTLAQWKSTTGYDAQTIAGDPQFVNAAAGDFHLRATSPAKGKGRDGEDIGAYPTGSEIIGLLPSDAQAIPNPPSNVDVAG